MGNGIIYTMHVISITVCHTLRQLTVTIIFPHIIICYRNTNDGGKDYVSKTTIFYMYIFIISIKPFINFNFKMLVHLKYFSLKTFFVMLEIATIRNKYNCPANVNSN